MEAVYFIHVWFLICFLAISPFCLHGPLICDLICKYLYISQLGMVYNENSTEFQFVKYTGILSLPMCIHTGIHAFKLYILFMCVTSKCVITKGDSAF